MILYSLFGIIEIMIFRNSEFHTYTWITYTCTTYVYIHSVCACIFEVTSMKYFKSMKYFSPTEKFVWWTCAELQIHIFLSLRRFVRSFVIDSRFRKCANVCSIKCTNNDFRKLYCEKIWIQILFFVHFTSFFPPLCTPISHIRRNWIRFECADAIALFIWKSAICAYDWTVRYLQLISDFKFSNCGYFTCVFWLYQQALKHLYGKSN